MDRVEPEFLRSRLWAYGIFPLVQMDCYICRWFVIGKPPPTSERVVSHTYHLFTVGFNADGRSSLYLGDAVPKSGTFVESVDNMHVLTAAPMPRPECLVLRTATNQLVSENCYGPALVKTGVEPSLPSEILGELGAAAPRPSVLCPCGDTSIPTEVVQPKAIVVQACLATSVRRNLQSCPPIAACPAARPGEGTY